MAGVYDLAIRCAVLADETRQVRLGMTSEALDHPTHAWECGNGDPFETFRSGHVGTVPTKLTYYRVAVNVAVRRRQAHSVSDIPTTRATEQILIIGNRVRGLILGGLFGVIDNQDFERCFARLQSESQLLLHGSND